CQQYHSASYSF
nr:immunoglobulin light chain junction region [Macaca mulatta]